MSSKSEDNAFISFNKLMSFNDSQNIQMLQEGDEVNSEEQEWAAMASWYFYSELYN